MNKNDLYLIIGYITIGILTYVKILQQQYKLAYLKNEFMSPYNDSLIIESMILAFVVGTWPLFLENVFKYYRDIKNIESKGRYPDLRGNPLAHFIDNPEEFKAELIKTLKEMPLDTSVKVWISGEIITLKKKVTGEIEIVL